MSDTIAPTSTEIPVVVEKKGRRKKNDPQIFSMNFWEDERLARKHIKENLLDIQQRSNNAGIKAHFSRRKDNGDGLQVMEVQFAETEVILKKDGTKETRHNFSGNDYIRVTFDPNRKFPKPPKKEGEEDGDKDKNKKGSKPATKFKSRA